MRTEERRMRKRPMRIRYTNRSKCLLCYLIAFAIPLVWQWAVLHFIYPYKLAATAPELMEKLQLARTTADGTLKSILAVREANWLTLVSLCALAAWIVVLFMQLLWRFSHCRYGGFRAMRRAVHTYRLTMLLIWGVSLGFATLLWQAGVRLIEGRTLWDLTVYFIYYLLLPFSAAFVSRLAAPAVISGRHAFFKRL